MFPRCNVPWVSDHSLNKAKAMFKRARAVKVNCDPECGAGASGGQWPPRSLDGTPRNGLPGLSEALASSEVFTACLCLQK